MGRRSDGPGVYHIVLLFDHNELTAYDIYGFEEPNSATD